MLYLCFYYKEFESSEMCEFDVFRISENILKRDGLDNMFYLNRHLKDLVGAKIIDTLITTNKVEYLKYR